MEAVTLLDIDLFFAQETWLMKSDAAILQVIREYGYEIHTERKPRTVDKGGGVAVIFKKTIKCKALKIEKFPSFECITVQVMSEAGKLIFSNIYYPGYSLKHRHTHSMFLSDLEDFFESLLSINGKHILFGDFNLHVEDETRPECATFKRLLLRNELIQHVGVATHINGGTLDLLICERESHRLIRKIEILSDGELSELSDHKPISVDLHSTLDSRAEKVRVRCQKLGEDEMNRIHERLIISPALNNLNEFSSIDEQIKSFNDTTEAICMDVAPVIFKTVHPRPRQRWYNEELRELKRVKRRAERKWMKQRNQADYEQYRIVKIEYSSRIKEVRTEFYKQAFAANANNLKETFNIVNRISGQEEEKILPSCNLDEELAEDFVNFFNEKIVTIRRDIQDKRVSILSSIVEDNDLSDHLTDENNFGEFSLLNIDSMNEIFSGMNKKYCSLDPMPVSVLDKCADVLVPLILNIVNKSLTQGVFPQALKHAVITPILKDPSLDPDDLKNYRPISNTPFVAKLIEKTVLLQLTSHLERNKLCSTTQSAYKEGHSCETLLLDLVNDLQSLVIDGKIATVLLLDLSAAFDTIDHEILLHRLREKFKVTGVPLRWISSYLENRAFSVKIREASSSRLPLKQGVPQGSILGPMLFILYIDGISLIAKRHGISIHVYADDMTLYIGFKPADEFSVTLDKIGSCMEEVKLWMLRNFLKLNMDKTQVLFCGKPTSIELYSDRFYKYEDLLGIKIGENLPAKVLGVKIDKFLNFDEMLKETCRNGYFRLNKLKNIGNALDLSLKISLVRCYILSGIDYCSVLYAGINASDIKRLQKLMNASVRFIYGLRKSERITKYMEKCHFLPVKYRILYKLCITVFKILHGLAPEYLVDMVSIRSPMREGLRSSAADMVVTTRHKDQTIAARMVKEWNLLPLALRNLRSLDKFKGGLKANFFRLAFES